MRDKSHDSDTAQRYPACSRHGGLHVKKETGTARFSTLEGDIPQKSPGGVRHENRSFSFMWLDRNRGRGVRSGCTGAGMSAHRKQLAALNTKSVTTLRELAAYHEKQAAGVAATPPSDAARFQSGKGAREPNEKELADLAATARTPSEHGMLQEYFRTLAKRYASDADAHAAFANTYRGTRIAQVAVYHDNLARASRNAAKEATAAAEMHKEMAVSTR